MSIQVFMENWTNKLKETLHLISDDVSVSQERRVRLVVHASSLVCALVAIQPLPFADIFVLTPIQVVMVTYISRVLGNPVGENGAKEILSYTIGVIGWGVLMQQLILAGYKTFIPYLGGITTIPLVYAATFGLGYAAKTVLEARLYDQKIPKEEIKQISKEATKLAKREAKIEWTIEGLKREWTNLKQQTEEFKLYLEDISRLEKELQYYREKIKDNSLQNVVEEKGLEAVLQQRIKTISDRFAKYNGVHVNPQVVTYLSLLSKEYIDRVEKIISTLHFDPMKLKQLTKQNTSVLWEISIDQVGTLFLDIQQQPIQIYSFEPLHDDLIWYKKIKNKHLRNSEIRQVFLRAIEEAKWELDIISPWMSHRVVDEELMDKFEKALERGVTIKILYGINDTSIGNSSRSDQSDEVAEKLRRRYAVYGDRFRIMRKNTHYKLLICDEAFYVQGSYNFLSFKGEYDEHTREEGAQYSENAADIRELRNMYFSF
ncbi:MAG: phospholipase D-like domain-containing protein [Anoxybacillus gonensis]|nr:phospholipase D-like domain-containing protein [Anoxybacillus gonensis]